MASTGFAFMHFISLYCFRSQLFPAHIYQHCFLESISADNYSQLPAKIRSTNLFVFNTDYLQSNYFQVMPGIIGPTQSFYKCLDKAVPIEHVTNASFLLVQGVYDILPIQSYLHCWKSIHQQVYFSKTWKLWMKGHRGKSWIMQNSSFAATGLVSNKAAKVYT